MLRRKIKLPLVLRLHDQLLKLRFTLSSLLLLRLLVCLCLLLTTLSNLHLLRHEGIRYGLLLGEANTTGCRGSQIQSLLLGLRLLRREQIHLLRYGQRCRFKCRRSRRLPAQCNFLR